MLLQNTYFALRHGESEANTNGIIVSSPKNGLEKYGLTKAGAKTLHNSLALLPTKTFSKAILYSSDFKRTLETAEIFRTLYPGEVIEDTRLRERSFGKLELKSTDHYETIWEHDKNSEMHCFAECETLFDLKNRLLELIESIESTAQQRVIVLVSHGDCLQVLQTIFDGISARKHRTIPHLEPGELRQLNHRSNGMLENGFST